MTPPNKAAAAAPQRAPDDSPSEHIYIGGDDFSADPATIARTVRNKLTLKNPVRRACAQMTFFEEGVLKITTLRNGRWSEPLYIDLRFLDPVPKIERMVATRWLYGAFGCGAAAALAAFLLRFDALYVAAASALGLAVLGGAAALYVAIYASYERIEFFTMHGRATVLALIANWGSLRRFRAFLPVLSGAIDEAAESIGTDTAAYLRAEMREHYRLRGNGVLSQDSCAAGTGRILAQFDIQI